MNQLRSTLFEPDILVEPGFFRAYQKSYLAQPERALLFAVLNEAVDTFLRFACSTAVREKRLFRETEAWIWDEESDFVFSFRNICELLGLEAAYLRRGLRKAQQNLQNATASRGRIRCRQMACRKQSIRA